MEEDQDITGMKTLQLGTQTVSGMSEAAYAQEQAAAEPEPVADSSLFAGDIPMDPFSGDPFLGQMVGNCKILEKINEGGSSLIYRAHNIAFNLDRVIKILKPALAEEEDNFQRFKQEAQLTARLDHPNILRVFDTGEI